MLAALNIGAFFPLLFIAAYRLPGGLAAVVGAGQPLVAAAAAWIMFGRPTTRRQLAWAFVAVIGVAMTLSGGLGEIDLLGTIAACAGTISMALGITLTREWGPTAGLNGLASTGWQLVLGGLMITPLVPLVDHGPWTLTLNAILGYAWLSLVGGALAYALWFHAARHLPPTSTSLLGPLSPITAAALGWIILGQSLTHMQTLGFTLALLSAVLGQLSGRPRHGTRHHRPSRATATEGPPTLTGGSHIRWYGPLRSKP